MAEKYLFTNEQYNHADVFASDEELMQVEQIFQEPTLVEVNEVVENIIKEQKLEEKKKKRKSADSEEDDGEVEQVSPSHILLVLGLALILVAMCLVIFVFPRLGTSYVFSQAESIQEQLVITMQDSVNIQASGNDFSISYSYDDVNLITQLDINEFNGESTTKYTSGSCDQIDGVLILDVDENYSEIVYVSSNIEKASRYTVDDGVDVNEYTLDTSLGFVIILDRDYEVCFYDFLDNEIYA